MAKRWTGSFDKLMQGGAPGAGALALDIGLDLSNFQRLRTLTSVSRTAAAKALTFTAQKAVPAWRAANHRAFHMRRAWLDRGVRYRMATAGNLNAQVGSVDKYMQRHVIGLGQVKSAASRLFVPTYESIGDVGTHTQERRTLARIDTTKRKSFKITTASGKVLIVRRKGKARTPLEVLGVLQHEAHIEPHLNALGAVSAVVNAEFPAVYERVLLRFLEGGAAGARSAA